jgi:hypothetical protein
LNSPKEKLKKILNDGNHVLVLSIVTIMEVSKPLFNKKASTNVSWLLNQIEKLPHTFIHSSRIARLELEKALNAFSAAAAYEQIEVPFANRFDTIVDLKGEPATKPYLNYPLSEIVWDLYNFGSLDGIKKYAKKLRDTFEKDRALNPKPSLKTNFAVTIDRYSKNDKLQIPQKEVKAFADWIYANPVRCPSIRLGFELWHKMLKNISDIPTDSDLDDFLNIYCLPYVDAMTVDRRMHGYVSQVSKSLQSNYGKKLFKNTTELLAHI